MQNDGEFKKYQLHKKFMLQQLVAKVANFANIRGNNRVLMERKKNAHFKTIS